MNYPSLAENITDVELIEIVLRFYNNAEDALHLFNARHLQFVDGPLLSILRTAPSPCLSTMACVLLRGALGLADTGKRLHMCLHPGLSAFGWGVASHSGPVALNNLQTSCMERFGSCPWRMGPMRLFCCSQRMH